MMGIYVITNKINGKRYIGQSIDIIRRWRAHRTSYWTSDLYLYRAMRKYGLESFIFEVLQECEKEELNTLEKYWINFYQSDNPAFGYNLTAGGDSAPKSGFKITDEEVLQIYELLKAGMTQQEISEKFQISQQQISLINLGESRPQTGIKYPIVDNSNPKKYCIDCGKKILSVSQRCKECEQKRRKEELEIFYLSKPSREELKEKVRKMSFCAIAKEFNVTDNAVRRWCDHYNLPRRKMDIEKISDFEWSQI